MVPLSGFTGSSVHTGLIMVHLLIHGWPAPTKPRSHGGSVIPSVPLQPPSTAVLTCHVLSSVPG